MKLFVLFLALTVAATIIGCGDSNLNPVAVDTASETEQSVMAAPAAQLSPVTVYLAESFHWTDPHDSPIIVSAVKLMNPMQQKITFAQTEAQITPTVCANVIKVQPALAAPVVLKITGHMIPKDSGRLPAAVWVGINDWSKNQKWFRTGGTDTFTVTISVIHGSVIKIAPSAG